MNNFEVALTKEICPVCGKEMDGPLIMNSLLTEKCAKYKDKVVFFIKIDESKSSKNSLKDIYREGEIIGIKRGADIVEHFEKYIITLKDDTQLIFIDKEAWNNLGLK